MKKRKKKRDHEISFDEEDTILTIADRHLDMKGETENGEESSKDAEEETTELGKVVQESDLIEDKQKEKEMETSETVETSEAVVNKEEELAQKLSEVVAENKAMKAIIEELKSKAPKEDASTDERNKDVSKGDGSSLYDPLGAVNQEEWQQLKEEIQKLTEELTASKQHASELQEAGSAQSLRSQLRQKEKELTETKTVVEDLELQLQSVKNEFERFRRQSESNAEHYEQQVERLSDQVNLLMKPHRHSHSKSLLEPFPEQCDQPFITQPSLLQTGASFGEDAQSTDVECSVGQDSSMDEMEEYNRKIYQLTQSLKSMGIKQKDLQRRLVEAQEERDNMKSVNEDLQQQVDASSPETSAHLRATVRYMENEIIRLENDNESFKSKLQKQGLLLTEEQEEDDGDTYSEPGSQLRHAPFSEDVSQCRPERKTDEGVSDGTEQLVDCSFEIMGEMANATSDVDIGISLSFAQYAGLLSAIQKAIKELETSKQSFAESTQSFKVLDRTLSSTLSISRYRVRAPGGEGEKRLDELLVLVREKEAALTFMQQMISDLRVEIKGHQSFTLQQEVQLEYIKQQLSASDKVISLTWEVEDVKKALEECRRELKAQRDLNDQQQQELTIQWQSKQVAVAQTLSQNHRVSSFSQQLEHVVEAKEALESEKQELEEALEQARLDAEEIKGQFDLKEDELYEQIRILKADLKHEKDKKAGILTMDQCQDMLHMLTSLDNTVESVQRMATEHLSKQKSRWLQRLGGIEKDCSAWKTESSKEADDNEALQKKVEELREMLVLAESLKERAEQEKIGVQEILSLTSETTSAEILNLQDRAAELSNELDQDKQTARKMLEASEEEVADLKSQLNELKGSLRQEQDQRKDQVQSLTDKLDVCSKEMANLDTRVRSYKDVIAGLNRDLATQDGQMKELNKIAEQNASAYRLEKERADTTQYRLNQGSEQLADSLQEISDLTEKCKQLESLRGDLDLLTQEKMQLVEQMAQLNSRYLDLHKRHDSTVRQLEEFHAKNEDLSRERLRLEEQLLEEQQNLPVERSKWEAEIVALSERETPRERWPQSILCLVQKCEEHILEESSKSTEIKALEIQSLLQRNEEREKCAEAAHQEEVIEWADEVRSQQETIEKLQQEMKERESILQQEITETRSSSEKRQTELEADISNVRELYDTLREESEETIQQQKTRSEQTELQLSEVQAKAREMMKEKDYEIEELKRSAPVSIQSRSLPESSSPTDDPSNQTVEKLQSDVAFLRHLVLDLTSSLEQSERTHELRNKADQVLRDEVNAYERSRKREGLDMDYVKNILVSAFVNGTLSRTSPMLMVLARLFEFSPEEMERIEKSDVSSEPHPPAASSKSSSSIFPSWFRP